MTTQEIKLKCVKIAVGTKKNHEEIWNFVKDDNQTEMEFKLTCVSLANEYNFLVPTTEMLKKAKEIYCFVSAEENKREN